MKLYNSWFQRDTLRQQLLMWVLTPMIILLILNVVLFYKFGFDTANRRHDRYLLDISKILRDQLRTEKGVVTFVVHTGALDILKDDRDQVYYSVSGLKREYQFGVADLPMPAARLGATPIYYQANYAGKTVRMMAAIMSESDVPDGRVLVMVAKTLVLHQERAEEWIWRILPAQIALIVFVGVMIWWGVARGLRPLLVMRDEISGRSPQNLKPLLEDNVAAEIRPLIRAFNQLLFRLEQSMTVQRRFIADAAHQLRTPLAGLKVQAELALRLNDPEQIHHSLQQMLTATQQTAHLVQQFLALARVEPEGQNLVETQKIDLIALCKTITGEWVHSAVKKNIDLGFETLESDCWLLGNGVLLGEALNNLIDNALRYSPIGGCVTVRVLREVDSLSIEVEDNGVGIAEDQRERVFERFYRVLGGEQTGCGLGLAIVRQIAVLHNGDVNIHSAPVQGCVFKLSFPAQKREATL